METGVVLSIDEEGIEGILRDYATGGERSIVAPN